MKGAKPRHARECKNEKRPKLPPPTTGNWDTRCPETVKSWTPILFMARVNGSEPNATKLKGDKRKSTQPELCSSNKEFTSKTAIVSNMRPNQVRLLKGNGKSGLTNLLNNIMGPRPLSQKTNREKARRVALCRKIRRPRSENCNTKKQTPTQVFPSNRSNDSRFFFACNGGSTPARDINTAGSDMPV